MKNKLQNEIQEQAMTPKRCICGRQGHIKDSRQQLGHVQRRYACECGQVWSTKETRDPILDGSDRKLKDSLADKLIALAQELMHG